MYDGYFIPKGSLVFGNIWYDLLQLVIFFAIHRSTRRQIAHDPKYYHNPMSFEPERFLASDTHTPEMDPCRFAFGWGRRKCPGVELADSSLFVTIAMTLAVFKLGPPNDDTGKEMHPRDEFISGTVW